MSYTIEIDSATVAALLARNLRPAVEAGAMAVAAAIQDELAPYPPAPARRSGKGYYVRGRGSFTARGKLVKASELLNRRWGIKAVPLGARLVNTASYAGYLHGRKKQSRLQGRRGWVREDDAIGRVLSSGEAQRVMLAAIARALRTR